MLHSCQCTQKNKNQVHPVLDCNLSLSIRPTQDVPLLEKVVPLQRLVGPRQLWLNLIVVRDKSHNAMRLSAEQDARMDSLNGDQCTL